MTRLKPLASLITAALLASAAPLLHAADKDNKASRYYEDALTRFEKNDVPGAIIQLKNALQADKTLLPVRVLLGKALLAKGDAAGAEIEFNEALRLGVDRAEVVVPFARSLIEQGKLTPLFEDARLKPAGLPQATQLQLLLVRASGYSDLGDLRSALKSIEEARAINPDSADPWLSEAIVRIRAYQLTEAQTAVDRALKLNPKSAEALYQKASIQHVQGRVQAALAIYDEALKVDDGHIESRLARAGIRYDLGQDKEAQLDLKELQSLAPNEPRATYLRALLAGRAGDAMANRSLLKEVTDLLDPVPIDVIRYRPQILMLNGMAHYGLNEPGKAKPYLEYALRQQPNSPLTKIVAQISISEGSVPRAIELLETYLRTRPGDAQALLMLASAHMTQGRHAKATAMLQEALKARDDPGFRTALGISLMRGGQDGIAVTELERVFKADPKQSYAGLALVNLYLRGGQAPKALKTADALVKSLPDNPTILVAQGNARERTADYAGARASYEAAQKAGGAAAVSQLGIARTEIATKKFDAAKQRIALVLKEQDRNVDALFEMAVLHEAMGKDDEALKWLESAVDASDLRETRPHFAIVTWHLRKGQAPKALAAAKLLLAKAPDDVDALRTYAATQISTNDLAGARASLANASRRAGFETPTQVAIARAQVQARDPAGAAYSLEKALTSQPNDLDALSLMAMIEIRQGDLARAERRVQQIAAAYPKQAVSHTLQADIAATRGQGPQVIEALRRAHTIENTTHTLMLLFNALATYQDEKHAIAVGEGWLKSHPKDIQVWKAVANAQARIKNFAQARRTYESIQRLAPQDVEILNNLANVLIQLQDPGALAVAEQALKLQPGNALIIDTAGWANHFAGKRDQALQLLREARLRNPARAEIRYHLAVVLAKAGRKAEARTELDAALAGGRPFEGVQDAKALLETLK